MPLAPSVNSHRKKDSSGASAFSLAPVRGRRRPWLIGLGALLASMGALTVVWLVGAAGQRVEVLAIRSEVAYGQVLTSADVAVARVSVDPGVAVVPAADRDAVIGQVATTRMAPGMLLTRGMLEPEGEPSSGRVLVPIAVPADRMPAGGLRAGDRVLLVDSEDSGGMPPTSALVVRVGPTDINGVTVVDVTTNTASGPALAVTGANGHVALMVEPSGG